jgi:hypothetical protein
MIFSLGQVFNLNGKIKKWFIRIFDLDLVPTENIKKLFRKRKLPETSGQFLESEFNSTCLTPHPQPFATDNWTPPATPPSQQPEYTC